MPSQSRAPQRGGQRRPPGKKSRRGSPLWISVGALALVAIALVAIASRPARESGGQRAPSGVSLGVTGVDFHSLVADPTMPGVLFVGGHESVSRSEDSGKTWSRVDALDGADAMGWAISSNAIYVTGHPGINRSTNGGESSQSPTRGLPDTDVHAFGSSPSTLYTAGPALGVSASTDRGKTWESRTQNAGQSFFGRILVDPSDDRRLVAADARYGAAASDDGGRTWRRLGGPPSALWVSRSGDTLYASGQQAAKTSDGGATWTDLKLPAGASLVEADPKDAQLLYAGVHRGDAVEVWVSRDGGRRWTRA